MNEKPHAWREMNGLAYLPAPDPLWREAPTPLQARYNVLGVPLAFGTNAPVLATLAEEVFGDWGEPEASAEPAARLHVFLHDAPEAETKERLPPLFRLQGEYFFLTLGASFGFADR